MEHGMDQQNETIKDEPVDVASFVNNSPIHQFSDWVWTHFFGPIDNFVERQMEKFTRHWVEDTIDEQQRIEEAELERALLDAEKYRKQQASDNVL